MGRCSKCGQPTIRLVDDTGRIPDEVTTSAPRLVAVPEPAPDPHASAPVPITDVPPAAFHRDATGLDPFDTVLGGGIVQGSFIVVSGEPGCGKSSCVLQGAAGIVGHRLRALYATGEETVAQASDRARRIGANKPHILIVAEPRLEVVLDHALAARVGILIVDSISTLTCKRSQAEPGSTAQVKACADMLMRFAKDNEITVIAISHVDKQGMIAGPKTLAHLADVVLMLEQTRDVDLISIRSIGKNRFGRANLRAMFQMTQHGLVAAPEVATESEASDEASDEESDEGEEADDLATNPGDDPALS